MAEPLWFKTNYTNPGIVPNNLIWFGKQNLNFVSEILANRYQNIKTNMTTLYR